MTVIKNIVVRKISDNRGDETVEVDVYASNGFGRAAVPSGASKGAFEAKSIPVVEAISKAKRLVIPRLIGLDVAEQKNIDDILHEIDGTKDFSHIGGNLSIGISMAVAKAAASSSGFPLYRYINVSSNSLPLPLGNVIGGGAHARGSIDIQEILVIPTGARNIEDAIFANAQAYNQVKKLLNKRGIVCGKGDEGAWAPSISDEEALAIGSEATEDVSDSVGFGMRVAIDMAATEMWKDGRYVYSDAKRSTEEQIQYVSELIERYNLYYVEDPLEENDFEGFAELTKQVKCMICGDDLFVTNPVRIQQGIDTGAANTVLVKPNQIGTVTDTRDAVKLANRNGYHCVMSHRSGETTDETIAHLAVALGIPIIKTGIVGGERTAKLNELIRIEEGLKNPRMTIITER